MNFKINWGKLDRILDTVATVTKIIWMCVGLLIIIIIWAKISRIEKLLTPVEGVEMTVNADGGIDEIKNNTDQNLYIGVRGVE